MRDTYAKIYLGFITVFAGMFLWLLIYDLVFPILFETFNFERPPREWSMPVCAGLVILSGYLYGKFFTRSRLEFYSLFLIFALTVASSVVADTNCARGGLSCDTGSPTYLILQFYTLFVLTPLSILYTLFFFKALTLAKRILLPIIWILLVVALIYSMAYF